MTKAPVPDTRPVVLTVAGSDSGGGAGIQADLKTIEACGGFGTSAVTAVTAQHTRDVKSTHVVPVEEVEAQIQAVHEDFDITVLKTGMLATESIINLVAEYTNDVEAPVVVDPVMVATSGNRLLDSGAKSAYTDLFAEATLLTPNAQEAEQLTGVAVTDRKRAVEAGRELLDTGVDAVLVKGGHIPGETVQDVLVRPGETETYTHPRVTTDATHGSGCMLASAIATQLAHDDALSDAVATATDLLEQAVRYHHDVGEGPGSVNHLVALREHVSRDLVCEAVERHDS